MTQNRAKQKSKSLLGRFYTACLLTSPLLGAAQYSEASPTLCGSVKVTSGATCTDLKFDIDLKKCGDTETNFQITTICHEKKGEARFKTADGHYIVLVEKTESGWASKALVLRYPLGETPPDTAEAHLADRGPASIPHEAGEHEKGEGAKGEGEKHSLDKSGYNLFNPVPAEAMRELNPDRPGLIPNPYSLDPGHFQIETGLYSYRQEQSTETDPVTGLPSVKTTQTTTINAMSVHAGITSQTELQLSFNTFSSVATSNDGGPVTTVNGIGDFAARLKVNLFGNDSGSVVGAIVPYVQIPTHAPGINNTGVQPGVMIPFFMLTAGGWGFGLMPEWDWVQDEQDSGYHNEFLAAFAVTRHLFSVVDAYVELSSRSSSQPGSVWAPELGGGLTVRIGENFQLDGGFNLGLNNIPNVFNPFAGLSIRF